ncbi:recQ-mediated genome instability protein 1-like [Chironomus tepperi]|uniref:recQ-mediated genome instability protein 1-like n=1 Tax=Chironomus tepperi TaxID=113505 RepID=UPI00391F134B
MDNSVTSRISFVRSKLVSDIKAKVQEDWLKECVSYFVQSEPGISNNQLYENVKDQFCLANISDTSNKVLSDTFVTKKDPWTLKESLLLQMQYILDISEPFYDQWRRLHDKQLDEVIEDKRETKTFQSKRKRMFKLQLTDGSKTVSAMEMKHIGCLNTKLTPGVKILIIGPVPVVNHIIMIKAENVKVIGGEVEELLTVNAYENVLLRLLNKPTTKTPILNYSEQTLENEKPSQNIPKNLTKMDEKSYIQQINQKPNKPQNYVDDIEDDDFDFAMIDAIEEQERQKSQENQLNTSALMIDDDDDYMLAQIDLDEIEQPTVVNRMETSNVNGTNNAVKANDLLRPSINLVYDDDDDMLDNELNNIRKRKSIESPECSIKVTKSIRLSPIKKPEITDNDYPFKVDESYNFITIDQYVGLNMRHKMEREYALEVTVDKILKIKADVEWLLIVQIKDNYSQNTISARIADSVVTELTGRTTREIRLMKMKMERGQPQLAMDITKTITSLNTVFQDKSILVCMQMKAKLPADYENVITKILEKTDQNKQMIELKIEQDLLSF